MVIDMKGLTREEQARVIKLEDDHLYINLEILRN